MKNLFISIIILILMPLSAVADAVEIDGIYYNLIPKGKIAEVTSNPNKYTGAVNIPEIVTYNDVVYNVTSIGGDAFEFCSGLTSVTIPNSVTSIGGSAFLKCSLLTSITIPSSVTSIGSGAFQGCSGLKEVHISDLEAWLNISFSSNPLSCAHHLYLNGKEIINLVIPNSVTSIGNYAFQGCSGLTSISIPNSVTSIGNGAFYDCSGLTSISIPNSVTTIGSEAFEICNSLTSIVIPNSVTSIGYRTFSGCSSLMDVYCYAENVPKGSANAFQNSFVEYVTLHIPESAIDTYRETADWSEFGEIVALPNYKLTYMIDGEVYRIYKYEEERKIPAEPTPTKVGYTFSGWSEIPETMPAHDVEVTGSFTINTYKLTYMVDGVEYKVADVEYGATIVPEEAPEKPSYAFTSWDNLPETMPAHDVTVTATYEKTILGKCATPTIAFKDGKFKFESEEEGVEFVWNINVVGNSGKGSEVGTPQKYVLSVCATKEFYEDSDPATMEMGMSSPIGDVNGDGVVNAADIATLVDIILHM